MAPKRPVLDKATREKNMSGRMKAYHVDGASEHQPVEMTAEERKAWEAKRSRALKVVKEVMKQREESLLGKLALRSFGIPHVVVLIHCTDKGSEQRKMVQMWDAFTFKEMQKWLKDVLYGKTPPKGELSVQWIDETGAMRSINNGLEYDTWRDMMWYKHPPELIISDPMGLVTKAKKRWNAAEELFKLYDIDGNGKIDLKEMLMAKQMTEILDVPRDEVQSFLKDLFSTADGNADHSVSFPEFVDYYNRLNEVMREGIVRESSPAYKAARLKSDALSARSWRKTISQVASTKEVTVETKDDKAEVEKRFGWLNCDANSRRNYAVALRIPKECENEENKDKWVQVSTWSEELVDGFADETGKMGDPMSPLVFVEFEQGTGEELEAAENDVFVNGEDEEHVHETGPQLPAKAELYMPHAFAERGRIAELQEWRDLDKKDIVVVRSVVGNDVWLQVPDEDFDIVPGSESIGNIPSLRVRIDRGGIYAAYSVINSIVNQRVISMTFVSGHVIPLDPLNVKLWLVTGF